MSPGLAGADGLNTSSLPGDPARSFSLTLNLQMSDHLAAHGTEDPCFYQNTITFFSFFRGVALLNESTAHKQEASLVRICLKADGKQKLSKLESFRKTSCWKQNNILKGP